MEEYNENNPQPTDEQEIDLLELAQKLWAEKKLIIKVCCIAAVIGLVVAFSIPKVYMTTVTLAPEMNGKGSNSGLSSLASLAGVNMNSNNSSDALTVNLYPDIVSSVPFLTDLFDVRVSNPKKNIDTTLYDYMLNDQKAPWWSSILGAPFKMIGWVASLFAEGGDEEDPAKNVDTFQLTSEQTAVMNAIGGAIDVSVDTKTGVTTLNVSMQDPVISAAMTDTVMNKLKDYITNYRTMKARHDLAFTEKLFEESRDNYYKAQQRYARYTDSNQNIILSSYRTESERLQNEMNLAYGVYNQAAQQLQAAKAKVMEITPVYAVVQPATVPLRPEKPKKMIILVGFVFMAFVGTSAWILFGRNVLDMFKGKKEVADEAEEASQAEA
jgi:hypothetical protein